ncbi:MAG TPA: class I SAM-dependent methyltransferase [Candidatus Blautia stercoravium]|nr:class I SAM-dependent methyltransferase [Candidatus Blautia stercoravium]
MKQKEDSGFWDKRSQMFDSQVLEIYKNAYKKTVKRSAAFLNQENNVLEIGCGTGIVTIQLADCVKEITAMDISREMLLRAEQKAKDLGKKNISFRCGTLMDMKFPPKSFDVVTAYNVLLYMENQEEVLDKIYKVLKPGGLFISATDCLGRSLSKEVIKKLWKSKLHLMPYMAFDTPIGLMRRIQKYGFLVLEIVNLHKNPPNIFIVGQKVEK